MSVCVSVRLFVYLQYYLFVFSITKKCPQKMSALGVRLEGAQMGAPKRGSGGLKKWKKLHLVQDPFLAISKINHVIRYSTYIASYRS